MSCTRGFITIATGNEEYYRLAKNLLHSYRMFCKTPLPFAILCDRENEYTSEFDDVILFSDRASNSYLDKLSLGQYLPYDQTIFIDSDCLAYGDLNDLFKYFQEADDFSCFGRVLPLDDKTGWFEYENLGEWQSQVNFVVGLHGGIYYMRNTEMTRRVFETAKQFITDYSKYKFKGKFETPGDEPLVALAMAVNGCKPIPFVRQAICCYWEYVDCMKIDITKPIALVTKEPKGKTILLHWGTRFTRELEYHNQIDLMYILESNSMDKEWEISKCNKKYKRKIYERAIKKFLKRVKNKIKRIFDSK